MSPVHREILHWNSVFFVKAAPAILGSCISLLSCGTEIWMRSEAFIERLNHSGRSTVCRARPSAPMRLIGLILSGLGLYPVVAREGRPQFDLIRPGRPAPCYECTKATALIALTAVYGRRLPPKAASTARSRTRICINATGRQNAPRLRACSAIPPQSERR